MQIELGKKWRVRGMECKWKMKASGGEYRIKKREQDVKDVYARYWDIAKGEVKKWDYRVRKYWKFNQEIMKYV